MTTTPPEPDERLLCPLCDYDLRGQVEPRCPECGYAFDWLDLRDPARRRHRYLFEHHPQRNVRSFCRTMLGGLLPRRFWGGLLPSQPSNPRRLLAYALVIVCAVAVLLAALAAPLAVREWNEMSLQRVRTAAMLAGPQTRAWFSISGRPNATTQEVLDAFAPRPTVGGAVEAIFRSRGFTRFAVAHGVVIAWPVLTLAGLMIFVISMRRARLRRVHFVRCVVYCADVILWGHLLLAALVAARVLQLRLAGATGGLDADDLYVLAAPAILPIVLFAFVYRIAVALKLYLRFDRPAATVASTQVIAFLVMLLLLLVLTNPFQL